MSARGTMGRGAWQRTPYAETTAKDTEKELTRLFEKYGVHHYQFTNAPGPKGLPAFAVRFMFEGRVYTASLEALDAANVPKEQLLLQVKRCIFWRLKAGLEMAAIFGAEDVFFSWLEGADGQTAYQAAEPMLAQLPKGQVPDFGGILRKRLLPPGGK